MSRKENKKPAVGKSTAGEKQKKKVHRLVGKIGWCDAQTLGLDVGHYVFIRRVYGDKCSVNTFTSLRRRNGTYKNEKMIGIEEGTIYPIPKKDATLPRFSGVHNNVIKNVPLEKVQHIGEKRLKRRHHHYIQKYVKK